MKRCTRCGLEKPREEFYEKPSADGRMAHCKRCHGQITKSWRARHPQKARAISREAYRRQVGTVLDPIVEAIVFAAQGGACAICRRPPGATMLCVDHDHGTGGRRGLLCDPCNRGLGCFADRPEVLRTAAEYVESRRAA